MVLRVNMVLIALFLSLGLTGQTSFWNQVDEKEIPAIEKSYQEKSVFPISYRVISIDKEIEAFLNMLPSRNKTRSIEDLPTLNIPTPDGGSLDFYVEEASVMHPELMKKFPGIKSFVGYGVSNKSISMRFDISHKGLHFMVLSPDHGTILINPIKDQEKPYYEVIFKRDLRIANPEDQFICEFDNKVHVPESYTPHTVNKSFAGDNDLREYRLAVACTGEYAVYHGGSVADAQAAINTTVNRVVGIYERDFSITMTLIANNNSVIYTNGGSDPFTNGNASTMINENRDNMNSVIGSSNFDIGHLFGTAGSGLAYLDGPCGGNKARATSAIGNPIGDAFDVDYVCHEIGHQFGANHTQYNSCNRNNATAMEPGSASTIMGYAGICSPNVQSNSDDYFHAISIDEIEDFTTNGSGNGCAVITDLGNTIPTVSAGSNYTIPKSTPFMLTATGSDADGDALTYCWEQMDNAGSATMPPVSTNTQGPMFRTLSPVSDNTRYFPNLLSVVNNSTSTWEVLSSVGRILNFRVTARDNAAGNGLTAEDDMTVTVNSSAGPFLVTSPNTSVQWNTGETKTVTWSVAGTNTAPVSCANVDILLSTDGGYTFPHVLATAVTNDGSHSITVPSQTSSFARVKIVCSDNIFYDLSDENFGINVPAFPAYCTISYNNNSCSTNDYIDDVIFESISNVGTGCALDGVNFSDYSTMTANVQLNASYDLTVKPTPNYAEYMAAYIDFNLDGDFLDADEFIDIGSVPAGTSSTVSVNIPNGTPIGVKLLRVVARYGTIPLTAIDGCGIGFNYGEYEDYRINVTNPCNVNETVMMNFGSGVTEVISASNEVNAANIISGNANITYVAGNVISLNNGFEVQAGASFEAFVGPCQ